jgi:hypothetical protein
MRLFASKNPLTGGIYATQKFQAEAGILGTENNSM